MLIAAIGKKKFGPTKVQTSAALYLKKCELEGECMFLKLLFSSTSWTYIMD